ncbi:hypothetical protein L0B53_01530 [Vibrio sp. SS-MA-C1-2]|uniref:hypothetical protein n=1 Tax=Vibrio sp. SS-MA-C1-2 TaxID=2908646 RepID=UPI001F3B844A|nr:hypothetical protein [Vibrio sp. SS-MA-C1-2]UJF17477.1 hypothetical protein L0B53_01530 [Vibrio sp. SS-MA-C1-2]
MAAQKKHILKDFTIVIGALLLMVSNVFALTPPGQVIYNQATASYIDSETGFFHQYIFSNTAKFTVGEILGVEITPDQEIDNSTAAPATIAVTAPGHETHISHQVINRGNVKDRYLVDTFNTSESDSGSLGSHVSSTSYKIKIYSDNNQNGQLEPEEVELEKESSGQYITPRLAPGEIFPILFSVYVPPTQIDGSNYYFSTVTTSIEDKMVTDETWSKVIVNTAGNIDISLKGTHLCETILYPGDKIDFRVDYRNTGNQMIDYTEGPYNVYDSEDSNVKQLSGVLITADVPPNITIEEMVNIDDYAPRLISLSSNDFIGGIVLVGKNRQGSSLNPSNQELDWYRYDTWKENVNSPIERIGFLVNKTYFQPNFFGHFTYNARVNESFHDQQLVVNSVAEVNIGERSANTDDPSNQGKTIYSNNYCNTLGSLDQPAVTISFTKVNSNLVQTRRKIDYSNDEHFEDTEYYTHTDSGSFEPLKDSIHARINLPRANKNRALIDLIGPKDSGFPIRLINESGEYIYWYMAETGPNTGIFKTVAPSHVKVNSSGIPNEDPSTMTKKSRAIKSTRGGAQCLGSLSGSPFYTGDITTDDLVDSMRAIINLDAEDLNFGDGDLTNADCQISAKFNERLLVRVYESDPEQEGSYNLLLEDISWVSPQMRVFNTLSKEPVADVPVTFYQYVKDSEPIRLETVNSTSDGTVPYPEALLETNNNGYFINVANGESYSWPTEIKQPNAFINYHVTDASYGKDGPMGQQESGIFYPNDGELQFDIPVDPTISSGQLLIEKTADLSEAEIGSYVRYTVTINNYMDAGDFYRLNLYDAIPYGFKYIEGMTTINSVSVDDPTQLSDGSLHFDLNQLSGQGHAIKLKIGEPVEVKYLLQLTSGAIESDGINSAYVTASVGNSQEIIESNTANFRIDIRQTGVLNDRSIIFGKVYLDGNCDGQQADGEWPIGGVKLYLETGDYVITDENGQYSLFGVQPGVHVLRADPYSLPEGLELKPLDPRNAGEGSSRFADVRIGEMHRADFAANCPATNSEAIMAEIKERNVNINGSWLLDEAMNYQGTLEENNQTAPTTGDLNNAVLYGPGDQKVNVENPETKKLAQFTGFAIELGAGTEKAMMNRLNKLDKALQEEAYLYQLDEKKFSLRIGFSPEETRLTQLEGDLAGYRIKGKIVPTIYEGIPLEKRFAIDNKIERSIPLPLKEAKKITRQQAAEGTWLWPTDPTRADGRFIAVVKSGMKPKLYLNGEEVNEDRLGEQVLNKRERAEILGWYGVPLKTGKNLVEIKAVDQFNNERVLLSETFIRPLSPVRVSITADSDQNLKADGGRSVVPLKVRVYDNNNNLVSGTHFITLDSDAGNVWLDPDIQDQETGHQVRVTDGEKTVYLRSSEVTGNIQVAAKYNDMEDETTVYQIADQRPLFVTGVANLSAKFADITGTIPDNQLEGYQDGEWDYSDRFAIFMKGRIVGGNYLTLSYDTDKDDEDFFRELNPESYYPIAGDASIRGYEARSTSKFYAKLERDRHFLMWGDYNTGDDANSYDLGQSTQVVNGLMGVYDNNKLRIQVYGAQPEDLLKVARFDGNGTAMFYDINGDTREDIVRHSETVTIFTYDRDNRGLVIDKKELSRYTDYVLDYYNGTIRFNDAIPSVDEEFNPITVQVTYDVEDGGDKYNLAGGRLTYRVTDDLLAGVSYETNEHRTEGYDIGSVWFDYELGSKTTLSGSFAKIKNTGLKNDPDRELTDQELDDLESGNAYRIRIKHNWSRNADTAIEYAYAEQGFDHSGSGIMKGQEELSIDHTQRLGSNVTLNIDGNHSKDLVDDDTQQSIGATVTTPLFGTEWDVTAGSRYIKSEYSNNSDRNEEFATGIVGLGRNINILDKSGRVDLEYERSFDDAEKERVSARGDLQVHDQAKVYAQYEFVDSVSGISGLGSGSTNEFSAGIEVDWLGGGQTYNELKQRGVSDGRELELINGYRGRFELEPGLSIDPSLEYVHVLYSGNNKSLENGWAASVGIADTRHDNYKTSSRVEYRSGESQDYYGVSGAWVTRINIDWSAMVREEFRYVDRADGDDSWSNDFSLGFAYRPRLNNRYNMLAMYEWKKEDDDAERDVHIASTHQNYQLTDNVTLSGRVGVKSESYRDTEILKQVDSVSSIYDGRIIYNIDQRWDLDIHGGVLATDGFESVRYSAGAGINYLLMKNLRLGIGYNLVGFNDDDLDPQGYNLDGGYINLMFKFDEQMFDWLAE